MSRLARKFNYGSEIKNMNGTLYNQLSDSYYDIAVVVNTKSSRYATIIDPMATSQINEALDIGDFWINSSTDTAWIMTSRTTTQTVVWKQIT